MNRYAMSRYLGHGLEVEEVVVHERFRRQGYGLRMLDHFIESVTSDPDLRRITAATDEVERAGRLYSLRFAPTPAVVYSRAASRL